MNCELQRHRERKRKKKRNKQNEKSQMDLINFHDDTGNIIC